MCTDGKLMESVVVVDDVSLWAKMCEALPVPFDIILEYFGSARFSQVAASCEFCRIHPS